jgi:hypothetical protein
VQDDLSPASAQVCGKESEVTDMMKTIKVIKKGSIAPALVTHEKKKFVPIEDIRKIWLAEHRQAKQQQAEQDRIVFEGGLCLNQH